MSAEGGVDGKWGKEVLSGQAGITPCMLQVFLSSHICGFIGFMVFLEMHYPSSMYYSCPGESLWSSPPLGVEEAVLAPLRHH